MEKQTVFIKRYPSRGEFPKGNGDVFSDMGVLEYSEVYGWDVAPEWWLEEIQIPSDEEILQAVLVKQDKDQTQFMRGIDYILGFINNKK